MLPGTEKETQREVISSNRCGTIQLKERKGMKPLLIVWTYQHNTEKLQQLYKSPWCINKKSRVT